MVTKKSQKKPVNVKLRKEGQDALFELMEKGILNYETYTEFVSTLIVYARNRLAQLTGFYDRSRMKTRLTAILQNLINEKLIEVDTTDSSLWDPVYGFVAMHNIVENSNAIKNLLVPTEQKYGLVYLQGGTDARFKATIDDITYLNLFFQAATIDLTIKDIFEPRPGTSVVKFNLYLEAIENAITNNKKIVIDDLRENFKKKGKRGILKIAFGQRANLELARVSIPVGIE